jgi:hypothetical protein
MVEFTVDWYEIVMKFIVPGMIILAVLGVVIYQMSDSNIFGEFGVTMGSLVFGGSGMKLP